ncbi:tetratricopeptide repeat protein [Solidesulfovibrio magneticus]|nr:tetratricopeptide repeat protein [Solidesulfovibrio magneticus]
MVWLRALGDRPDLLLETLLVLTGALPESTAALRELAVEWQSRVVEHLRQQQDGSIAQRVILATSLNNFANRLSEAGQRTEALENAQKSTALYSQLTQANPDAFLPDLARSLNNLANRLSDLGQREEALPIARKSAQLYVTLANQLPEAFEQKAINTLLTWLSLRHAISREEAVALLKQNPQAQFHALFNDGDSDEPSPSDKPSPQ